MTGNIDEQVLIFNYGKGANGKSTLSECMRRLFGDYAATLNPESVSGDGQRRGDQATPDIADLPAARLVIVSELPKNVPIKENLIKALTGGEPMKARHLNKGFFDFKPTFKGMMSGNAMPTIYGTDHGIWRRILIVPWDVNIDDTDIPRRKMEEVQRELEEERSGILNWLLRGLEMYLTHGLIVPKAVSSLTDSYKDQVDRVGGFIKACLVQLDKAEADSLAMEEKREVEGIRAGYLYECFTLYCQNSGIKPPSMTAFGMEMIGHGIDRENKRVRRYLYVVLADDAAKPPTEGFEPRD